MQSERIPARTRLSLLPVPARVDILEGAFRLDASFAAAVRGPRTPRLYAGASRMLRRLSGRTGLFLPQDYVTAKSTDPKAGMIIRCRRVGKLVLGEDESYTLKISSEKVELAAETDLGALRGLETLLQLLDSDAQGYCFPAVRIQDKPRFAWRGLHLDVCRHFMPLDALKRNLDALAAVKMNVLHLHLSDDQGFRVESKAFPKLHELASDGLYYTHEQVREIIAYAGARGIRILPEFGVPGHATSWLTAYPALASAPGPYALERGSGIFDACFDPTKPAVYRFLEKFFAEMAALFPDEYFHIGGDENNGKQWDANPAIQKFKKEHRLADNSALQGYFNERILNILSKLGKTMVGWDEILRPGMPKDIVVQTWRDERFFTESAKKGFRAILSKGYYLDLIEPASSHYLTDPLPPSSSLSASQKKNVLGGEAAMWVELADKDTLDSRIWPRTAAIAERLWSSSDVRDVDDMYRRLAAVSFRLEELGLTHIKNQDMMLRRLAGGRDPLPLRTLIDALEPVKGYARHKQGVRYTSYSPLTRVVDAALPETTSAREFSRTVDAYLTERKAEDLLKLRARLSLWKDNHAKFMALAALSPILKESLPLSANLAALASAGLESLDALAKKKDAPWIPACAGMTAEKRPSPSALLPARLQKTLEEARKPYGQAELAIVPAIEKLIFAAC
ncbi:MAG: family 20 glycosylhydrolase [Elusimicrobiota bacterium]|jgi:hexosaminidase